MESRYKSVGCDPTKTASPSLKASESKCRWPACKTSKVPPRATSLYGRADRNKLRLFGLDFEDKPWAAMGNSFGFLEASAITIIPHFRQISKERLRQSSLLPWRVLSSSNSRSAQ